ncbi:unnamed protein product [Polarella glacialis]|uniref:Calmodulin n=1 Tax=Polarella glacialis TaxID=89957 RepID=A0A813HAX1_POLGL|nr:unnamed protein product [Polarella glacialis]CAE8634989.1 unnamed protein product [Polarella glacialis]
MNLAVAGCEMRMLASQTTRWRRRNLAFKTLLACVAAVYAKLHVHASRTATFTSGCSVTLLRSGFGSFPVRETKRDRHVLHFFGPSSEELQDKLDRHIVAVNSYTDREVACILPKWRTLLIGIKAGLKLPSLLKAIHMLYVDILPLRIGGDYIMNATTEMIQEGNARAKSTIPDADLILASTLFDALDVDSSGQISEHNLRAIGFTPSAITEIMDALDADGNHQIDMSEFFAHSVGDAEPDIFDVLGHNLASADIAEDLSAHDIQLIVSKMRSQIDSSGSTGSKYEARFNKILQFIIGLEPRLEKKPLSSQRVQTILAGSFEAAKDPDVVTALRFVYSEVRLIRIAGDLIYGIVTQCVGS